jgi:hypothetical protein
MDTVTQDGESEALSGNPISLLPIKVGGSEIGKQEWKRSFCWWQFR